jgi:hypothetical protein
MPFDRPAVEAEEKVMKKSMIRQAQADEALLELGKVLGQSMAFGTVAGRCSAAQAAALGQARSEKTYRRVGLTWKEFCPKHLRMSGTQADEIIRLLREFGPEYFENTESVRISADTYRLVAPFIQEKTLRVEGETLELNSANVQKVAKGVRESQRALPPPAEPAPAALLNLSDRIDALYRHSMGIAAEFREVAKDCRQPDQPPNFHAMLRSTITLACCEMKRVSLENGVA